jgi:phenylalanyl-tRNA synthetase alpha subunit
MMLLSHTTASIADFLIAFKPIEIFTISKIFRAKKERREKTQIEITLIDRNLSETMAFICNLYSQMLNQKVKIQILSDFYYFCEPSFSFKATINGDEIMLGSGGFVRQEILNLINKRHKTNFKSIIFLGFPYQKILNLSLGKKYNAWETDYNLLCQ